MSDDTEKDV